MIATILFIPVMLLTLWLIDWNLNNQLEKTE